MGVTKTRICSQCKNIKPFPDSFYKHKYSRGGYRAECKDCSRSFKSQQPESVLKRVYATRTRNRQFIWDYYASHPCVDCGETDPKVLELDHLDPTTKVRGVSALVHDTRSLQTIQTEIDKCDVVCANCHRRRTAKTQGWYSGLEIEEGVMPPAAYDDPPHVARPPSIGGLPTPN